MNCVCGDTFWHGSLRCVAVQPQRFRECVICGGGFIQRTNAITCGTVCRRISRNVRQKKYIDREKINANQRQRRQADPEKIKAEWRKRYNENPEWFRSRARRTSRRNLELYAAAKMYAPQLKATGRHRNQSEYGKTVRAIARTLESLSLIGDTDNETG